VVLSAGFGLCGTAETIIGAIARRPDIKDLTGVSNNAGDGVYGLGEWLFWGDSETRGEQREWKRRPWRRRRECDEGVIFV
jgi:hypothetical protein